MTGIIIAGIIIGLICLVGGVALFMLLPIFLALLGVAVLCFSLLVVAVMLLPSFVTLDDLKPDILSLVKETTGREITIGGPIGFSVWPVLGLHLRNISIGNPHDFPDPIMLTAQELSVGVTLKSLLKHQLDLRELRLVGAQINLSKDEHGTGNWVMVPVGGDESAAKPVAEKNLAIGDVRIQRIEVKDTTLNYDLQGDDTFELDKINLTFTMPSLEREARLSGSVAYKTQPIALQMTAQAPGHLLEGEDSPVTLEIEQGDSVAMTVQGQLGAKGLSDGRINAKTAWLKGALAGLGVTADPPVREVALQSGLIITPTQIAFEGMTLNLDDLTVTGKAGAAFSGERPRVTADVDVSPLNLDKLSTQGGAGGHGGSSDATLDLSGLDAVNAAVTARLAGVTVHQLVLGAATAKVSLLNGRLDATLSPASFYDGTVAGKLGILAGARTFSLNTTLENVTVEPILTNLAEFDKLTGHGTATLALRGRVDNVKTADGEGKVALKDGAIKGVNIAALVRRAKATLGGGSAPTTGEPEQTDFSELSGTFKITDGVVKNDDLKMLSPLLRVTGKGTASLSASTVNYKIAAALVADLTGQGGVMQQRGLVIPVNITGSFDSLSYTPDLQGLVLNNLDAVKNLPQNIQEVNPKDLREGAKGALQNLLGR